MRKTVVFIFGVIILQLNFSCKTQYSATELKSNFSTEQIADLNKIAEFFKNQMCLNTNFDFEKCYKQIPHEYLEATGNGFWTNINFERQRKLYKEISKSTFDEIWMFCESKDYPSGKEIKILCANATGKYQNFLADLGKTNPRIAKYAKWIWDSGDFYSLDIHYSNIINDKKHFDLNDPNFQLILAIHYLSINDQQMRNEKPQRTEPKFK